MIIDSSALLAILTGEPERQLFNDTIANTSVCLLSVATFVEASLIIENRYGYDGLRDLDLFIAAAGIELVPVDVDQAYIARQAFRQYGKGHHPANLNFGDCFSYALAKSTGQPLLFKGDDFAQTDVTPAVVS
jgi:ribonuclease VapC